MLILCESFPPKLLFFSSCIAPSQSPSSYSPCWWEALFCSRKGASGNEVSGRSPGMQHSCFPSSPPKLSCQKGMQQFLSCVWTKSHLLLAPNKPPSNNDRPRGPEQMSQDRTAAYPTLLSNSSQLTLMEGPFSKAVTAHGGAKSKAARAWASRHLLQSFTIFWGHINSPHRPTNPRQAASRLSVKLGSWAHLVVVTAQRGGERDRVVVLGRRGRRKEVRKGGCSCCAAVMKEPHQLGSSVCKWLRSVKAHDIGQKKKWQHGSEREEWTKLWPCATWHSTWELQEQEATWGKRQAASGKDFLLEMLDNLQPLLILSLCRISNPFSQAACTQREPGWGQQPFNQSFPNLSKLVLSRQDILSQKSKILLWRGSMVQHSCVWTRGAGPQPCPWPCHRWWCCEHLVPVQWQSVQAPLAWVCPTSPDLSNRQRKVMSSLPCGYCHPPSPTPGSHCTLHRHRINP